MPPTKKEKEKAQEQQKAKNPVNRDFLIIFLIIAVFVLVVGLGMMVVDNVNSQRLVQETVVVEDLATEVVAKETEEVAVETATEEPDEDLVVEEQDENDEANTDVATPVLDISIFSLSEEDLLAEIDELFACEGDYMWERLPEDEEDAAFRIVAKDAASPPVCTFPAGFTHTAHLAQEIGGSPTEILSQEEGKVYFNFGNERVAIHAVTSRAESVPGFYDEGKCEIWAGEARWAAQELYDLYVSPEVANLCPTPIVGSFDPSLGEETHRISEMHGLNVIRQGGMLKKWSAGVGGLDFEGFADFWYLINYKDGLSTLVQGPGSYNYVNTVTIYADEYGTPCEILHDVGSSVQSDLNCTQ